MTINKNTQRNLAIKCNHNQQKFSENIKNCIIFRENSTSKNISKNKSSFENGEDNKT